MRPYTDKIAVDSNDSRLTKRVKRWINAQAVDSYDKDRAAVLKDLFYGGCASGIVGELIYYHDTARFYKLYRDEIDGMIKDMLQDFGQPIQDIFRDWDEDDPFARDTSNQNTLAWYGFEETARAIANDCGIDA